LVCHLLRIEDFHAKVVKPATACRKANYSRDTIYCTSGITAAALSTAARPPESVGVSNSRERSNMRQGRIPEMPETAFFAEIREKLVRTANNS
jgi:hypothetical protein